MAIEKLKVLLKIYILKNIYNKFYIKKVKCTLATEV
jgi:hypothetical protein